MTDETVVTEPEPTNEKPSLDTIISQYVSQPAPAAATPEPAPVAPVAAQTFDPLDEGQLKNYVQQVSSGQSTLNNQLHEVQASLTQLREETSRAQINTDITDAVTRINEGLDLDPRIVRVHLEMVAQEKPGFKAIWDNRKANPGAYTQTLSALSREIGETYAVKADPALTQTQVAISQSQQSLATSASQDGSDNPMESALASAKTDGEFDQLWQQMKAGM